MNANLGRTPQLQNHERHPRNRQPAAALSGPLTGMQPHLHCRRRASGPQEPPPRRAPLRLPERRRTAPPTNRTIPPRMDGRGDGCDIGTRASQGNVPEKYHPAGREALPSCRPGGLHYCLAEQRDTQTPMSTPETDSLPQLCSATPPQYILGWPELARLSESETHRIEMDPSGGCGWIKEKGNPDAFGHYLSTHTFYGLNHKHSTEVLRRCGWHVTCANWDGANNETK